MIPKCTLYYILYAFLLPRPQESHSFFFLLNLASPWITKVDTYSGWNLKIWVLLFTCQMSNRIPKQDTVPNLYELHNFRYTLESQLPRFAFLISRAQVSHSKVLFPNLAFPWITKFDIHVHIGITKRCVFLMMLISRFHESQHLRWTLELRYYAYKLFTVILLND